jgi:hypothetical protein
MEIKIINLDTGEQTVKNHRKLVKKLVEKNRIPRKMRNFLFDHPYDLIKKLNLIRFNNCRYEGL